MRSPPSIPARPERDPLRYRAAAGRPVCRPDGFPDGAAKPSIISIVEEQAPAAAAPARGRAEAELKAPQSLPTILRLLDDVMKTRIAKARLAAS